MKATGNKSAVKTLIMDKYAEGSIEEKKMAKKLLRRDVSIDIVVEDTELTRKEVETIKADLDQL